MSPATETEAPAVPRLKQRFQEQIRDQLKAR